MLAVAPYGSWVSPLPIERLTDRVVFLAEARGIDGVRCQSDSRRVRVAVCTPVGVPER